MRARWIKPESFRERALAAAGPTTFVVYHALRCYADDGGVVPADADLVYGQFFLRWPSITLTEVSLSLSVLHNEGYITMYTVGVDTYAAISDWKESDIPHPGKFRHPQLVTGQQLPRPLIEDSVRPSVIVLQSSPPRHLDTQIPRHLERAKPPAALKSKTPVTLSDDEQRVMDHYLAKHRRRKVNPQQASKLIGKALSTFTVDELLLAIDGNANDAWHIEKGKHELSYVFRDEEKISSFIARATPPEPRSTLVLNADGDPTYDSLLRVLNS